MRTVASLAAVMVLAAMALAAYLLVEEADAVAWIGVPIAAVATAALTAAATYAAQGPAGTPATAPIRAASPPTMNHVIASTERPLARTSRPRES